MVVLSHCHDPDSSSVWPCNQWTLQGSDPKGMQWAKEKCKSLGKGGCSFKTSPLSREVEPEKAWGESGHSVSMGGGWFPFQDLLHLPSSADNEIYGRPCTTATISLGLCPLPQSSLPAQKPPRCNFWFMLENWKCLPVVSGKTSGAFCGQHDFLYQPSCLLGVMQTCLTTYLQTPPRAVQGTWA